MLCSLQISNPLRPPSQTALQCQGGHTLVHGQRYPQSTLRWASPVQRSPEPSSDSSRRRSALDIFPRLPRGPALVSNRSQVLAVISLWYYPACYPGQWEVQWVLWGQLSSSMVGFSDSIRSSAYVRTVKGDHHLSSRTLSPHTKIPPGRIQDTRASVSRILQSRDHGP